jgi:N-acetylglucosaminyldiphosphoundecaprenol N-acetyl-beta-D-mannosaminyltransferase
MIMRRVNILGVDVSAINLSEALEQLQGWIVARQGNYVCVAGVHGIMESWRDNRLRSIHNRAGMVAPDGMPLVWLSWCRGFTTVARVYGPELMLAVCERSAATGWRHFFYGGELGIADRLTKRLEYRFPNICIAGSYTPPFRTLTREEDDEVIELINRARPDFVWVGISTPRQEYWMADHVGRVGPAILIGCGAAFDFNAGSKRQAPRWVQRTGLEWCFRLINEPRRLWRRYLFNNPQFVALVMLETIGLLRRER